MKAAPARRVRAVAPTFALERDERLDSGAASRKLRGRQAAMSAVPIPAARTLRADLRHSYCEGVLYAGMVGVGESYLSAFVLAAGHGAVAAGWVATLPMLAGAWIQSITPYAVERLGSHKRWVVVCVALQACCFAPLIAMALHGSAPLGVVFAAAALYWACGLAAAPAWNTWITSLVPPALRARFFALRTRACNATTLASLLIGGAVLELLAGGESELHAFAVLFALAAGARWWSSRRLAAHSEPTPMPAGFRALRLRNVLSLQALGEGRSLIVFMLFLQFSAHVAAAFYTPYMLDELELSYGAYVLLVATAFVGRMLALPWLGDRIQRFGAHRIVWLGALGIAPAALPWVLTDNYWLLLASQLTAGACWAAYELATLLLFFEHVPERERTNVMTVFNVGHASAIALGSIAGGLLLGELGAGANAYLALFTLTTVLRVLALALLRRVPARPAPARAAVPQLAPTAVRPSLGALERPVWDQAPDGEPRP